MTVFWDVAPCSLVETDWRFRGANCLQHQDDHPLRFYRPNYTEWSKSHATHIKIFIHGCDSIQFDWINKHAMSLWLYKNPRRSCHVVTCSRQSVSCLQTVEVQGCIFHKCNKCSLYATWHLVLTLLARMSLGVHFPILLCQTNRQYLVWWTVSVTQELFTGLHQTWGKEWLHASLNAVDISNTWYNIAFCFLILMQFIFWQREHMSGMGDLSVTCIWRRIQIMNSLKISPASCYFLSLSSNIPLIILF
jgi:hypothetical protein